jgi:hypothetical protein
MFDTSQVSSILELISIGTTEQQLLAAVARKFTVL